jgi:hypothetical protein
MKMSLIFFLLYRISLILFSIVLVATVISLVTIVITQYIEYFKEPQPPAVNGLDSNTFNTSPTNKAIITLGQVAMVLLLYIAHYFVHKSRPEN